MLVATVCKGRALDGLRASGKGLFVQCLRAHWASDSSSKTLKPQHEKMLKVRLARPDDFLHVAAITADDPKFARQDYLLTSFHEYLEDPYLRCLVAELDGRPIGFLAAYCGIDEGASIAICAVRVLREHRYKYHTVPLCYTMYTMFPRCNFLVNGTKLVSFKAKVASRVLELRNEYQFSASEAGMNRTTNTRQVSLKDNIVEPLCVHGFCDLFDDGEAVRHIFPNERFVMDMLIAQPSLSNKKLVQHRKDCIAIFISRSLQKAIRSTNNDTTLKEINVPRFQGLLSYNTWFPCPAGFISKIEFYGRVDSREDVEGHLRAHAECFRQRGLWGEVKISVDSERMLLDEAEFKRICQDAGFTAHDEPMVPRYIQLISHLKMCIKNIKCWERK